jgi:hypothetical protein
MAWTKTRADADQYFKPTEHVNGQRWQDYQALERDGAFAQAVRLLEASQGRTMQDPSGSYEYSQHDDYAVYEQALWLLMEFPRKAPGDDGAVVVRGDDDGGPEMIAPEAQLYLRVNRVRLVRG